MFFIVCLNNAVLSAAVKSDSLSYLRDSDAPSFGLKNAIFILPTAVISSAVTLTLGIILAISVSGVVTAINPMP